MAEIDARLREEVHLLGELLGHTISTQLGKEFLDKIERIRKSAKAGRRGSSAGAEQLSSTLGDLDDDELLPVARAFYRASMTGEGAANMKGALDLIFTRAGRPVGEDAPPFQVFDGERLVPVPEYLSAHPRPDLLDLARRMEQLGAGPRGHRAGDVLLLTRTGLERPISERYYFAGHYHSWHGSPSAQDSRVTFIVARRGEEGARVRARVAPVVGTQPSLLDVTPLVRELLGVR